MDRSETEGLVQRKHVINRDNNSDALSSHNDNSNPGDIDEGDSKETRFTLMEEVLLLGLKDKEVSLYFIIWLFSVIYDFTSGSTI